MSHNLLLIMTVPLVVWLGVFGYLLHIDRSLRRLEHDERDSSDL